MGKILFSLIFSFILVSETTAQVRGYLSPGVKLGYAFGENGGFTWGVEISYVFQKDGNWIYGFVISNDFIGNKKLLHFGVEGGRRLYGFEIGPTLLISDEGKITEENKIGFSTLIYAGGFIIPYYRYTYIPDFYSIHEAGTFLKIHIQITGPKYHLNLSGG